MEKKEHKHDVKSSHKIIKKSSPGFTQETMMLLTTVAVVLTCAALVIGVALGLQRFGNELSKISTNQGVQNSQITALSTKLDEVSTKVATGGTGTTTAPAAKVTVDINAIKGLFTKDNITMGNANSKVLFVEVSDPSCPYCHIAAGKNPELGKQSGDKFTYDTDGGTYQSPVREMRKLVESGKAAMVTLYSNGHGAGEIAMQALYCANEKGKYWDVHDLLYSNAGYTIINQTVKNDVTKSPELASFLASAVDSNFMKDCLTTGKYKDKLAKDIATSQSLGVQGTPGFFVNTTNFAGAYSYADMKSAVDTAMK